MALDKAFLESAVEGITEDQANKILKEYDSDITGLKVNKETILNESKANKEKLDKLAQEREAEKTGFQKQIEELENRVKASGSEETKSFYEAEKKKIQDMYAAKLTEAETKIGKLEEEKGAINAEHLRLLKNNELDRAMDTMQNLDQKRRSILRDVFWARNQFDITVVDGEKKLLNKEYKNIGDALNAYIATEEGKGFLLNNNSGGGAPGSSTPKPAAGNPFLTGNITEQMRMHKENPALAASLEAQAKAGK